MALAAAGMAGVVAAAAYEMWTGILGQAAGRFRVGAFAEGPDPGPSAKIFYFFLNFLCRGSLARPSAKIKFFFVFLA